MKVKPEQIFVITFIILTGGKIKTGKHHYPSKAIAEKSFYHPLPPKVGVRHFTQPSLYPASSPTFPGKKNKNSYEADFSNNISNYEILFWLMVKMSALK